MHMADALVTPAVAGVAAAMAAGLLAVAACRLRRKEGYGGGDTTAGGDSGDNLVPLMGVMGAFVFAAQMINFTIPGTGSSGHIVGGVLLAALLGPWAALLTLSSVLIVQCLIFADGGLMALGCNLLNMGVCSTLVAYPLVYRPIVGNSERGWRIAAASVVASVVAMELGALLVTAETALSGVAALPVRPMLVLMLSIHLLIGLGEGVATAALLCFIRRCRPSLLVDYRNSAAHGGGNCYLRTSYVVMGIALAIGAAAAWIASSQPDGLEWTIDRMAGPDGLPGASGAVAKAIGALQHKASVLPDYGSSWAGIVGSVAVVGFVWLAASLLSRRGIHRKGA